MNAHLALLRKTLICCSTICVAPQTVEVLDRSVIGLLMDSRNLFDYPNFSMLSVGFDGRSWVQLSLLEKNGLNSDEKLTFFLNFSLNV